MANQIKRTKAEEDASMLVEVDTPGIRSAVGYWVLDNSSVNDDNEYGCVYDVKETEKLVLVAYENAQGDVELSEILYSNPNLVWFQGDAKGANELIEIAKNAILD
jgi:hypothetical protein